MLDFQGLNARGRALTGDVANSLPLVARPAVVSACVAASATVAGANYQGGQLDTEDGLLQKATYMTPLRRRRLDEGKRQSAIIDRTVHVWGGDALLDAGEVVVVGFADGHALPPVNLATKPDLVLEQRWVCVNVALVLEAPVDVAWDLDLACLGRGARRRCSERRRGEGESGQEGSKEHDAGGRLGT